MTSSRSTSPSPDLPWSRQTMIMLLEAAIASNEPKYARLAALSWLSAYSGDLRIRLLLAKALMLENHPSSHQQTVHILEEICQKDPEFTEAQKLLSQKLQSLKSEKAIESLGCVLALEGRTPHNSNIQLPKWAFQLYEARHGLLPSKTRAHQSLNKAEVLVHQALLENPQTPLVAVTHVRVMTAMSSLPVQAKFSLAKAYHERWPDCIQFILILADNLMESGSNEEAVELLHRAVSQDVGGQVATRLWGPNHPYHDLWPDELEIAPIGQNCPQALPIPSAVAAYFGWNQLPGTVYNQPNPDLPLTNQESTEPHTDGEVAPFIFNFEQGNNEEDQQKDHPKSHPLAFTQSKPLSPYQDEMDHLAAHLKLPHLANLDGRFPVYVIFTTKLGLEEMYGQENALLVDAALKRLVRAVRGQRIGAENWGAILYYPDDPTHAKAFDLEPACHNNPWNLKLSLADLDAALEKRGERIGAVLIVGGPEIVPFHQLPNPVDDTDPNVLSDNPYSTRDDNYFVAEWPVGRLPAGASHDPGNLLHMIQAITERHLQQIDQQPWYLRVWQYVNQLFKLYQSRSQTSFGYSAAIWRRASLSVYRVIGEPRSLAVSPPMQACDSVASPQWIFPSSPDAIKSPSCLVLPACKLGYFNLHGLPDASEWYGQRDPTEPGEGLDFPIAIRPQDVRNSGQAPQVIFSEACYGAHILDKKVDEAISLKFLTSGSQAVVGSTCICYGSIGTPLIAADLLGRVFWSLVIEGVPVGEAFRRAKLHLAREMHRRQGFLDGEDQKTLISFVLYGDPLAQPYKMNRSAKVFKATPLPPGQLKMVCDRHNDELAPTPISAETTAHIRQIVTHYLPGMADAQISLTQEHTGKPNICGSCDSCSVCPTAQKKAKPFTTEPDRQVIVLSKKVEQADLIHQQYARLTLDKSGKLVKLVLSR